MVVELEVTRNCTFKHRVHESRGHAFKHLNEKCICISGPTKTLNYELLQVTEVQRRAGLRTDWAQHVSLKFIRPSGFYLGLQKAQSRSYLDTSSAKVSIVCMLGGLRSQYTRGSFTSS